MLRKIIDLSSASLKLTIPSVLAAAVDSCDSSLARWPNSSRCMTHSWFHFPDVFRVVATGQTWLGSDFLVVPYSLARCSSLISSLRMQNVSAGLGENSGIGTPPRRSHYSARGRLFGFFSRWRAVCGSPAVIRKIRGRAPDGTHSD